MKTISYIWKLFTLIFPISVWVFMSPAYAGGMADQSTYCGSGSADSTCLGNNAFNEVGWCQGGIVYQGQCMTPSQYCTNEGNVWYNGTCISQSTYCTSVLNKVWYNGQCMDQQTYCSAIGNIWSNGSCISPQAYCSALGETWYNGQCMQTAQVQCLQGGGTWLYSYGSILMGVGWYCSYPSLCPNWEYWNGSTCQEELGQ